MWHILAVVVGDFFVFHFEGETSDWSRNLNNNIELSYMAKGIDK